MYVRRRALTFDSRQAREKRKRKFELMKEFKMLNEMRATSEAEAEKICEAIEKFVHDHPELKPQIEAYYVRRVNTRLKMILERLNNVE